MHYEFGTDGVRGKANETLTVRVAYRLGSFLGAYFAKESRGRIIIGKDTRLSSGMFEAAVASGIAEHGSDAYLVGYAPTPSIAHLVVAHQASCGVMISASHNPYYDNGIKVFSGAGAKLDRSLEEKIEEYLNSAAELPAVTGEAIGQVIDWRAGLEEYLEWLRQLKPLDLTGMRIALDTANGSASFTAKRLLAGLGAECDCHNDQPNGININNGCGSTHPEAFAKLVREGRYDIGFAFDGDADRLIAVAPDGQLVDGDKTIYALGKYLLGNKELTNGAVVTTVMANLGLFKKLDEAGIAYKVTKVGDKYVYEEMLSGSYDVGGEQSGHIIFRRQATTGDGLLTALNLLEVMQKTGRTINELTDDLFVYPQLLVNVRVKDKEAVQKDPRVIAACERVRQALGTEGRILVRPSGTEPLLRVMVEAKSDELCRQQVDLVVKAVKEASGE